MKHGSLFSGIGGFDLAAEWMGWENVFHCEWNEFGQKILNYYWPKAKCYGDITKTDFTEWCGKIDIVSGGFPCQPYSLAGKRKGKEDERHLWPEMLRAITEIQPRWVVGENVFGLVNWSGGLVFHEVQADLEAAGYEVWPYVLPACGVNAPHQRDRIWFVAHASSAGTGESSRGGDQPRKLFQEIGRDKNKQFGKPIGEGGTTPNSTSEGRKEREQVGGRENTEEDGTRMVDKLKRFIDNGDAADTEASRVERNGSTGEQIAQASAGPGLSGCNYTRIDWSEWPTQSPLCSGNDGFSPDMDNVTFFKQLGIEHQRQPAISWSKWRNESIKAAGNAIVPQVVYQIFKAIEEYEIKTQCQE